MEFEMYLEKSAKLSGGVVLASLRMEFCSVAWSVGLPSALWILQTPEKFAPSSRGLG
jgi:hypothetical protein